MWCSVSVNGPLLKALRNGVDANKATFAGQPIWPLGAYH